MRQFTTGRRSRFAAALIFLAGMISGCGGARDETVAGVTIPVPGRMERVAGRGVELSIPGFGGGQAVFQGKMALEEVTEFYRTEMPPLGWQPGTSLLSRGGMLSYSKQGKTVLLAVSVRDGETTLNVTVSNTAK